MTFVSCSLLRMGFTHIDRCPISAFQLVTSPVRHARAQPTETAASARWAGCRRTTPAWVRPGGLPGVAWPPLLSSLPPPPPSLSLLPPLPSCFPSSSLLLPLLLSSSPSIPLPFTPFSPLLFLFFFPPSPSLLQVQAGKLRHRPPFGLESRIGALTSHNVCRLRPLSHRQEAFLTHTQPRSSGPGPWLSPPVPTRPAWWPPCASAAPFPPSSSLPVSTGFQPSAQ